MPFKGLLTTITKEKFNNKCHHYLQGNIPDGYELIPVDQLTSEYEVVPFDKVIQVLNVSSINKVPENQSDKITLVYPSNGEHFSGDLHHTNRHLDSEGSEYTNTQYNKNYMDHSMQMDKGRETKHTSTKKPIYLPSFFSDTNKLLTMFKPPPFSPDLYGENGAGKTSNGSPDLPSVFYNDFPRPGNYSIHGWHV